MMEHIAQASSSDASNARATFVVGTGHACREIIKSPRYKPLATLEGVSNVHMANKGSDGKSKLNWAPHLSIITRFQLWRKLTGDLERGTAQFAKFVRFAKSAGGDLRGKIVESAIKALVTARKKKTGDPRPISSCSISRIAGFVVQALADMAASRCGIFNTCLTSRSTLRLHSAMIQGQRKS
jgi:hypothetical protein